MILCMVWRQTGHYPDIELARYPVKLHRVMAAIKQV
jgi:hypothetical protein